jgi:hypothetical protein
MNIRTTIPKNRDNSGTALLYIVGPDFLRPGFRRANVRHQPRRATNTSAVGCMPC